MCAPAVPPSVTLKRIYIIYTRSARGCAMQGPITPCPSVHPTDQRGVAVRRGATRQWWGPVVECGLAMWKVPSAVLAAASALYCMCRPRQSVGDGGGAKKECGPTLEAWATVGGEPKWPGTVKGKERLALSAKTREKIVAQHEEDPTWWPPREDLLLLSAKDLCAVTSLYFPKIKPRPIVVDRGRNTTLTIPKKWMVHMLESQTDTRTYQDGVGRGNALVNTGVHYEGKLYTTAEWQQFALEEGADDFDAVRHFGGLPSVFSDRRVVVFKEIFKKVRSFGLESEAIAMAVVVMLTAVPALQRVTFTPVGTTKHYDLEVDCPCTCVETFLKQLRISSMDAKDLIRKRKWNVKSRAVITLRIEAKASDALANTGGGRWDGRGYYEFKAHNVNPKHFDLMLCSLWCETTMLLCATTVVHVENAVRDCGDAGTRREGAARTGLQDLSSEQILRFLSFQGSFGHGEGLGWSPIALIDDVPRAYMPRFAFCAY